MQQRLQSSIQRLLDKKILKELRKRKQFIGQNHSQDSAGRIERQILLLRYRLTFLTKIATQGNLRLLIYQFIKENKKQIKKMIKQRSKS